MELIYFGLIWFLAGFINGISGMGLALVAVPLLSLFMDIQIVIPLACLLVPLASMMMTWSFRKHCNVKSCIPFIISSIPGAILGTLLLSYVPTLYLQIAMSLFLIFYVLWSLGYKKSNEEPQENKAIALICGFFSGLSGSSISFAGPPVVIYAIYARWNAKKVLATLGFTLFFISLIAVFTQAAAGLYTKELIPYILIAIPTAAVGILIALPVVKYISQENFRRLLLVIIGISGIIAGLKALDQLGIF